MSKQLRILQVNKFYFPWIGGVEKVVQDLSEGLSERFKDQVDIKVLVCQPKGKAKQEFINEVQVIKSGSFGKYFSMPISVSFFRYFKKLSQESDIICIHMPFPLADLANWLFRPQKKLVVWWHSDVVKQKKLMLIYKPLMNWMLKRADAIIVATEGHINSSKYLGRFKDKCKVIPFGINLQKYEIRNQKKILTQNLYNKNNKKILFVGRLVYYKGVEVLINTFKSLQNCELFIVGDGVLLDSLKSVVKDYNLENIVHFMGKLSDNDLKSAFSDCDIFVLPSIENSEAFGLVQLEAMVYKKPVINTSLPTGVPCVSLDGFSGFTVKPGSISELQEAIEKLVNNDKLRNEFGNNAFSRVDKFFNMDKTLNNFYNLCKNMVCEGETHE